MPVVNPPGGTGYPYQSNVDFGTVHDEVVWWLNNISNPWTGNPNGGEMGNDIGTPMGTPVYAVVNGKAAANSGYYNGGGVVTQIDSKNPQHIWYYQHLDYALPFKAGDDIQIGQLVGYSGGEVKPPGYHVATCCSDGPHIEVGVNAPPSWGNLWGNVTSKFPNINSFIYLSQLAIDPTLNVPTQGGNTQGPGNFGQWGPFPQGNPGSSSGSTTSSNPGFHCWQLPFGFPQVCVPDILYDFATQPIRFVKLVLGVAAFIVAVLLVVVPVAAGPAIAATGIATGQPELVAAGGAIAKGRATRRRQRYSVAKRVASQRQQQRLAQQKPAAGGGTP